MKLEVGMYVRTKYGIGKIISNPNESRFNLDIFKKDGITLRCIRGKDVFKASHTLLGDDEEPCLIEVGDYVNGQVVTQIIPNNRKIEPSTMIYTGTNYFVGLYNECIETIVTKEQFEAMAYKVV